MKQTIQKKRKLNVLAIFLTFLFLLLGGVVLAVCVGKYPVSPGESISILWSRLFGLTNGLPDMTQNVVMGLRVPRILASVVVGAALSMSGAAYQGIFKNPLVSPEFLGVSSGACIGAALAILLSLTTVFISLFAFVGGIIAVLLTVSIPSLIKNRSNLVLVLSGIIVGSALSSVFGFIKFMADPDTQLASITYWAMGSFSYIKLSELLTVLLVIIVPAVILVLLSWWIDVLSLGENEARSLGANVKLIRRIVITCSTILTAGSVCIAGTIGWVGLIIPHFGRMLVGPSNRRLIPLCGLIGGLFMLLVDTLTRTIGVAEMPVSILTGIIGAPFYCWLLFRQRRTLS
ncbi:MAG: iron ABC transporter permease [Firmicutes bacterium HGW-Firmicutes-16]|nr:MAG: iron ABC transporter permease [Firmicutes bacterium HGW-Firmicutes-16]